LVEHLRHKRNRYIYIIFNHISMSDVIGVAFPIPKSYISRFFDDGKTVFVKPATIFKELRAGMKFIFYQSHEDTGYVGEAIIKKTVILEDPFSFFKIYGDDIYLTKEELENYFEAKKTWTVTSKRRKSKPRKRRWIAIELDSITKYDTPIKPERFVPVSGQYIKSD